MRIILPNLTRFAREKQDIIWGVGFKFNKAIPEVADQFPDHKFGIVDDNLGERSRQRGCCHF